MICLPDGVRPSSLAAVNQIKAFAIRLGAQRSKSEQSGWQLTNEVINSAVAWHWLACCLGKLPDLSAIGPDRQRRSLKRQPLYRCLDFRLYDPSGTAVFTCL